MRPRYEVVSENGRRRINHPNVERVDLKHDEEIRRVAPMVGKGFILPAADSAGQGLPKRMPPHPDVARAENIPVIVVLRDANGAEVGRENSAPSPATTPAL